MSQSKYIKLTLSEINSQLQKLSSSNASSILTNSWKLIPSSSDPNTLQKNFTFNTFEDTWAFLTKVSLRSHLTGHHPKITTVYNKVQIELTTHDVDGLTGVDFKLAKRFSSYADQIGQKRE